MNKVVFAIVGCGRIAQRHAEHIAACGRLAAVCDIIPGRAEDLAKKHGCAPYADLALMLAGHPEVDLVSVCTPNGRHAEHSIAALEAGKHTLCEKPMALTSGDCRRMIEASRRAGRHLFIVKQNRFNPPIVALKRVLDEGRLGRILDVQLNCFWNRNNDYYLSSDWKGKRELDGGTLYTQFSHFIDLIYWLAGDVAEVHPLTGNLMHQGIIEFEDSGVVALRFASGALGTINYTVNSHRKNMEGSITVFGEKGTVKVGGQYLNVLEYQAIQDYEIADIPESRPANEYGFYQGSMSNHDKVYANVVDVLTNRGKIATTAEEGMKTVEIIERIYRAASR